MKAIVAAFNQEKALVGAFSVITNLRMQLFEALTQTRGPARGCPGVPVLLAVDPAPGEGVGVLVGVGDGPLAPELVPVAPGVGLVRQPVPGQRCQRTIAKLYISWRRPLI